MSKISIPKGKYLVTGGAGFIGSHLCERLLKSGAEVLAVDCFLTGSRSNLQAFELCPRFSFREQDVVRPLEVPDDLAGIFHLASPASPVDYARYPIETLHVGAIGSDNVLRLAEQKRCPVIVASTSEVYGDPLEHPQREDYTGNVDPTGPRGSYDESKRYMEALAMAYHRDRGVRSRIVRIFNTYGPRMRADDGRVIPNFCMQALAGEPIAIYGDGRQTRSFCYVDDLIEGIVRAFLSDHAQPINLGNPEELPVDELAAAILRLSGSPAGIAYRPLPPGDPKRRRPDISRARELLDWEPRVPLAEGLERTYAYFASVFEQQRAVA